MKTTDTLTPSQFLPMLPVGTPLTLELRYKDQSKAFGGASRVIGYRDKKYVLIEMPADRELGKLLEDPSMFHVVVRGLSASKFGDIFAFQSHILSVMHRPEKMLAIAIPQSIGIHRMRKNPRFSISRIVQLELDDRMAIAKLSDISLTGCGVRVTSSLLVEKGQGIRVVFNKLFESPLAFSGEIANVQSCGEGLQLGVCFSEKPPHRIREAIAHLLAQAELTDIYEQLESTVA
ncbi:PilZ domain-containing protein [Enterovibrio norvegicus]|uniref:PilZ domain-containing protein n=1 Tax=Enterovibrio norvegicus TaxID=188144 RepID=UPI003551FF3E